MAYVCSTCDKAFTRMDSLRRHEHTVRHTTPLMKRRMNYEMYTSPLSPPQKYLIHPFTMMIAGPTSCGKTVLLKQILENRIIKPVPVHIVWYYKIWQPLYTEMMSTVPGISFVEGLPDPDELMQNPEIPRLFVLDDLMAGGMENKEVSSMFTEGSHHHNFSVCFIVQNLFYGGKMQRTISLN